MPERYVSTRVTETSTSRGQTSVQAYSGNTVRQTTSTTPGYVEDQDNKTETQVQTSRDGTISEVETRDGVGSTRPINEDKGVVLKFSIPIQQKNPIPRIT